MIEEYDPNSRWGEHTWEFTFQAWKYTITLTQDIGGNCKGFTTMDSALSSLADRLYAEQGEFPELHMTEIDLGTGEENTLLYGLGEDMDIEDELKDMLVKAELINFTEEKK